MINKVLQKIKEIELINKKFVEGTKALLPSQIETFCSFRTMMNKGTKSLPGICADYKFKTVYTQYHYDLTFKSDYYKPQYGIDTDDSLSFYKELKENNDQFANHIEFDSKNIHLYQDKAKALGFEREAEQSEIEKDIAFLNQIATEWQTTINIKKHTDQKLKQTSEETRDIIRKIKRNAKKNNSLEGIKENEIKLALWKSKYLHYQGMLIAEQIEIQNPLPYELKLNGVIIYFTYRSLIHILYRHFAQLISDSYFQGSKSYHSPIFQPDRIHLILENIFARLSHSKFFKDRELKHNVAYNFKYYDKDYQFYLKEYGKNKDKLRVSSIYPIENKTETEKLKDFELNTIDSELKVYNKP